MSDTQTDALNSEMLKLTGQLRQQAARTFGAFELTAVQGMLLAVIYLGVDQPTSLATNLKLRRPTVSMHLGTLETLGLVERQRVSPPEDERGVRLTLTLKGKKTAKALLKTWRDGVQQNLRLTAEEHEAFEAWCMANVGSLT